MFEDDDTTSSGATSTTGQRDTGVTDKTTTETTTTDPTTSAYTPIFGATSAIGSKPKKKSSGTFLGTGSYIPTAGQLGQNTLLGQV